MVGRPRLRVALPGARPGRRRGHPDAGQCTAVLRAEGILGGRAVSSADDRPTRRADEGRRGPLNAAAPDPAGAAGPCGGPMVTGAQALLRTLVGSGVELCFANPGTSEMHFVAALDDVPDMRAVLALFE